MLEPPEPRRAWLALAVGLVAIAAMLGAGRLAGRRRQLAAAAALMPLTALMLMAGRVPDELVLPGGWSELAGGISRGISDLPGVRVPYRGLDDWVRTVIPLGGAALVLLAAVLAFWPRRNRLGFPGAALLVLVALYVVPVDRDRLRRRVPQRRGLHAADGRLPAPGEAAPPGRGGRRRAGARGDARRAGRRAACSTATRRGSTTRRGRWRRRRRSRRRSAGTTPTAGSTGRATAASCCACAPASPRTGRPRTSTSSTGASGAAGRSASTSRSSPTNPRALRAWTQRIKVSIRNLRTDQFITAGYASELEIPRLSVIQTLDGLYAPAAHAAPRRRLHRARLHAAPDRAPAPRRRRRLRLRPVRVHDDQHRRARRPGRRPRADDVPVLRHRPDGDHLRASAQRPAGHGAARERPVPHLRARAAALGRRPHARGVRAARARAPGRQRLHLQRGAAEGVAHARRLPVRRQAGLLPAVLGRDGAAAADGRHPGARGHRASRPARPTPRPASSSCATSTRTPGSRSTTPAGAGSRSTRRPPPRRRAASPPTPRACPARAPARRPSFGGDPLAERGAGVPVAAESAPWWRIPAIVARRPGAARPARARPSAAGAAARRRRCPNSSARSGARAASRRRGPPCTRSSRASRQTPAAAGYVRALRESRYRDAPGHPTRAQRRGLRSELGRGGGILGRLRAWWALPPR